MSPGYIESVFTSESYLNDPYAFMSRWQKSSPVFVTNEGGYYLTRYKDCKRLLEDPAFLRRSFEGAGPFTKDSRLSSPLEKMVNDWMVFSDPPRHTELRSVYTSFLTSESIRKLEPYIRNEAAGLLQPLIEKESLDIVESFAFKLSVRVICKILGVPNSDSCLFNQWASNLTEILDSGDDLCSERAGRIAEHLMNYFKQLLCKAGTLPEHCLTRVVAEQAGANKADMLCHSFAFLLWAGHETTKVGISNGVKLLAETEGCWASLKNNPDRIPLAVEEVLRFESPLQKLSRWTREDVYFGEYKIPKGSLITTLIGSANRDAAFFERPNNFIPDRKLNRHLAFGKGLHHCLGASLARLEMRLALEAMLEKIESVELVDYQWRQLSAFRSLDYLTVNLKGY